MNLKHGALTAALLAVVTAATPAMADWTVREGKDDFGRPNGELTLYSDFVLPRKHTLRYPFNNKLGSVSIFSKCQDILIYLDVPSGSIESKDIPYLVDGREYSVISDIGHMASRFIEPPHIEEFIRTLLAGEKSLEIALDASTYGKPHFTWSLKGFKEGLAKVCPDF
ncbi:hypothetical protein BO91_00800 [Candidatus Synechococcus spongiarum LMB bulk10E]|nr:hypothetical protein BO91_00800 [Candidatus Synechococcus spongiarum LMB bulk10E]